MNYYYEQEEASKNRTARYSREEASKNHPRGSRWLGRSGGARLRGLRQAWRNSPVRLAVVEADLACAAPAAELACAARSLLRGSRRLARRSSCSAARGGQGEGRCAQPTSRWSSTAREYQIRMFPRGIRVHRRIEKTAPTALLPPAIGPRSTGHRRRLTRRRGIRLQAKRGCFLQK